MHDSDNDKTDTNLIINDSCDNSANQKDTVGDYQYHQKGACKFHSQSLTFLFWFSQSKMAWIIMNQSSAIKDADTTHVLQFFFCFFFSEFYLNLTPLLILFI